MLLGGLCIIVGGHSLRYSTGVVTCVELHALFAVHVHGILCVASLGCLMEGQTRQLAHMCKRKVQAGCTYPIVVGAQQLFKLTMTVSYCL